ncbi:hypothetical protein [Sphingomonas sp. R86521]|uniref:hypothetical protein n=1 Tax=Sphingomonas sp. R86521 TaxID=3093860 RepID=UPI0036D4221A
MRNAVKTLAAILGATMLAGPASADLVLSQMVVDLPPGAPPRVDVEASNTGSERIYVVADPAEIVDPGKPGERRVASPDPAVLGLLVTPQRMILEPGERKLIRIAAIAPRTMHERIYRVTIKPVAGDVVAQTTALKLLVGYDVLVMVRPSVLDGTVNGIRSSTSIALTNAGTTNVELYEGKQCDSSGKDCRALPPKRLYSGATWSQTVDPARPVEYRIKTGQTTLVKRF